MPSQELNKNSFASVMRLVTRERKQKTSIRPGWLWKATELAFSLEIQAGLTYGTSNKIFVLTRVSFLTRVRS